MLWWFYRRDYNCYNTPHKFITPRIYHPFRDDINTNMIPNMPCVLFQFLPSLGYPLSTFWLDFLLCFPPCGRILENNGFPFKYFKATLNSFSLSWPCNNITIFYSVLSRIIIFILILMLIRARLFMVSWIHGLNLMDARMLEY